MFTVSHSSNSSSGSGTRAQSSSGIVTVVSSTVSPPVTNSLMSGSSMSQRSHSHSHCFPPLLTPGHSVSSVGSSSLSSGSTAGSGSEGSINSLTPPSPPRTVSHHHHHHHLLHHHNQHQQQQHQPVFQFSSRYDSQQNQESPPVPPVGPGAGRSFLLTHGSAGRTIPCLSPPHHHHHHHNNNCNNNHSNNNNNNDMILTTTPSTSQQSLFSGTNHSSSSTSISMDSKSLILEHEYQNLNESLMLENRRLKAEIEVLRRRCAKYERVESEIVKVCQAHEDLMASSERKEQLEKSVRLKLEAEILRLNNENRELKLRCATSGATSAGQSVTGLASGPAVVQQQQQQQSVTAAAASPATLAEYELQAQRATLEEQRFHIQILDHALVQAQANIQRLESQLQQQQQQQQQQQSQPQSQSLATGSPLSPQSRTQGVTGSPVVSKLTVCTTAVI